MNNKLEIHGLDLTAMGISDVDRVSDGVGFEAFLNDFARQILGSITFGPNPNWNGSFVIFDDSNITDEDDADWEYAE